MTFYQTDQHLVYPGQPLPQVAQAIPETRLLNGSFFAVPRTLQNSQILRYWNYLVPPVITESNYDFPRPKNVTKPYATQILGANFLTLHPRCFNLSDMGCVAGETLIETSQGPTRIDILAERRESFWVRTKEGYTHAPAPFLKGIDLLYQVSFASGRSVAVTKKHVFWTSRGWISCAALQVGERLPVFDDVQPASTSESCLSKYRPDARRSSYIEPNCQGRCDIPSCDAPLRREEDSVLVSLPSRDDFRERSQLLSRMDDLDTKHTHNCQKVASPLSTLHYVFPTCQECTEFLARESEPKQVCNSVCICGRCLQYSSLESLALGDPGSQFDDAYRCQGRMEFFPIERDAKQLGSSPRISQRLERRPTLAQAIVEHLAYQIDATPQQPPFDTVTNIAYVKTDVYYDMHVPGVQNYIAHGLCHHNTGKTMTALWAADWLMRQHPPGTFRVLIVAPLSILQRVWADAIFKTFLGKRTCEILHGTPVERLERLRRKADFSCINFDGVGIGAHTRKRFEIAGLSAAIRDDEGIKLVIIDEASAYKDSRTKRHRIARSVIANRPYLWLMTGTPTPNAPTDAFGLAKLVNNAFGKSRTGFMEETMQQVTQFKWVPRRDGYEKAAQLLSPSIRFDIRDVWDAPEMVIQQRQVELTEEQVHMLAQLKKELAVTIKSGAAITAANEAAARSKYLQISLGAVYDGSHVAHKVDASPRIAELEAVLEEAPGKWLCFVPFTSAIDNVYRHLKSRWKIAIVNGHVSQKERSSIFTDFQEGDLQGIIADPGTMAHGLDLWMARTVIWLAPVDKAELFQQANKRAHRPGQKYPVSVVQIVSNKLEIEIFRRLENNLSLQGSLLDLAREGGLG